MSLQARLPARPRVRPAYAPSDSPASTGGRVPLPGSAGLAMAPPALRKYDQSKTEKMKCREATARMRTLAALLCAFERIG